VRAFKRRLPDDPTKVLELPFDQAKAALLPRVARPFASDVDLPCDTLVEGALAVYLAIDAPRMMAYVDDDALKRWGKPFSAALAVAVDNLRDLTPPSAFGALPSTTGAFAFQKEDAHDGSRVLLIKEALSPWPKWGAFVGIPSRDMAAFVPVHDVASLGPVRGLAFMTAMAFRNAGNHAIAPTPFWFDGARWERVEAEVTDTFVDVTVPDALTELLGGPPG
jgi:hypothetical protein